MFHRKDNKIMDAFLKMFQNTCFIAEQQVTDIEGVIMSP